MAVTVAMAVAVAVATTAAAAVPANPERRLRTAVTTMAPPKAPLEARAVLPMRSDRGVHVIRHIRLAADPIVVEHRPRRKNPAPVQTKKINNQCSSEKLRLQIHGDIYKFYKKQHPTTNRDTPRVRTTIL
jgi:hypothetical protein